jgi:hypothetical protein
MEHTFAVENHLVEQYLLKELSPDVCDEFEDHYFGCVECATDLRTTDEFLKSLRIELQRPQLISKPSIAMKTNDVGKDSLRPHFQWRPAFGIAALAACLVVTLYQNTVTFPRLRNQIAVLNQPEVFPPSLSLVGGSSRGGNIHSVVLGGAKSLLLQVDIPSENRFTGYQCTLYSPDHRAMWIAPVSSEQAKDTVSLRAPFNEQMGSGIYSLEVQGIESSPGAKPVELTNYSFHVSTDHN